jgi:hypothetical protein
MAWGNLMQLSPFDVLQTFSPDYSSSNGVNPETLPTGPLAFGSLGYTTDGRKFRLAQLAISGTTLAPCKTTQGPAQVAAYHLGTVSAQSIGDTTITYTFAGGAQTVAANVFAGGYIGIVTGTGSPQQLQISGNGAVTSSTTIVLNLQDPIAVATSAAATAEVYVNPFSAPIITPATTFTSFPTGVPMIAVTSSSTVPVFFWSQVEGPAIVLSEGTTAIGLTGVPSDTTAGAIGISDTTGDPQIAIAVEAGSDGLYTMWDLKMH